MKPTQKIVLRNVEEVHLFDEETQKLNKVCSYPSKVQVRSQKPILRASQAMVQLHRERQKSERHNRHENHLPLAGTACDAPSKTWYRPSLRNQNQNSVQ